MAGDGRRTTLLPVSRFLLLLLLLEGEGEWEVGGTFALSLICWTSALHFVFLLLPQLLQLLLSSSDPFLVFSLF